jgi:hypothetical protein
MWIVASIETYSVLLLSDHCSSNILIITYYNITRHHGDNFLQLLYNFILFIFQFYSILYFRVSCLLRRIFGPKRDEVTGEWRKLHNEELRDLYSSRSIIRIIKSRRMRWAGHVARMGEKRNAYRLLVGKPERRSH